jgi:hypothetical protein
MLSSQLGISSSRTCGTEPWFLTKNSSLLVRNPLIFFQPSVSLTVREIHAPSLKSSVSGASTLNGCTPVNLIKRGSRGTWWSGVSRSRLRISFGPLGGGGRGISGSSGTRVSSLLELAEVVEYNSVGNETSDVQDVVTVAISI